MRCIFYYFFRQKEKIYLILQRVYLILQSGHKSSLAQKQFHLPKHTDECLKFETLTLKNISLSLDGQNFDI